MVVDHAVAVGRQISAHGDVIDTSPASEYDPLRCEGQARRDNTHELFVNILRRVATPRKLLVEVAQHDEPGLRRSSEHFREAFQVFSVIVPPLAALPLLVRGGSGIHAGVRPGDTNADEGKGTNGSTGNARYESAGRQGTIP